MKILLIVILSFGFGFTAVAQNKGRYKIKIVQNNGHVNRGIFYAANDSALVVITNAGDTLNVKNAYVKHLYIQKRGVILPIVILGSAIATVLLLPAESVFAPVGLLIVLGVVTGGGLGNLIGELIANKKYYKNLQTTDFAEINAVLHKYTQIK
jgi:hypothetical protein